MNGISLEEVLESEGLPNVLWKEELDFSIPDYCRFMTALGGVLTDEQILMLSDVKRLNTFLPPLFAALCAKNGAEALERFALFKRITCPLVIRVEDKGERAEVHLEYDYIEPELPRFPLLNEQLIILNMLRTGTGKELRPLEVAGPYPYGKLISTAFSVIPKSSEHNYIAFTKSDLQIPFLTNNNVMWKYIEPGLRRELEEISRQPSFTTSVERAVYSAIPGGRASREDIASSLGVSVRTMQRKLQDNGTTYADVVKNVQYLLAVNYLKSSELSLEEISYLVGYNDQTSFSRAFKSWSGKSPSEFRAAL